MLSAWLQRQDNVVQKGVPSWSCRWWTALQSMGEHETADRISNWWWRCEYIIVSVYVLVTAENDLCDVFAVIRGLVNWEELGLQLGLLYLTLKRINIEQRGIISSCKLEMLSAWLQRQDNVVQKGVPSWSVLRTALQSMGEHETADRISNWWWVVSTSLWVCVVPLIQEQEEEGISTTQSHTVSDTGFTSHYYTMIIDWTLCQ